MRVIARGPIKLGPYMLVATLLAQSPLLDPSSPVMREAAPARFRVNLDTTKGLIAIDVTREWAPRGADRFYNLIRHGYYDGVRFHRVTAGRWAQFGINGTPPIAKAWRHATIPPATASRASC